MSEYKEIQIKTDQEPVEEVQELEVDLDNLPGIDTSPINVEDPQEEPEPVQEQVKTQPRKPEQKRTSRAQKRIRELASEKNELARRLEQLETDNRQLKSQLIEGHKVTKESLKSSLENQVSVLAAQMKEAMRSGDSDLAVEAQTKLAEVQYQLLDLKNRMNEPTPTKQDQEEVRVVHQSEPSEKAMEWVEDYPVFKSDELFRNSALTINNQLLREGFDPESDDFYEELNTRLSIRFPEVFNTQTENMVEYQQDNPPKQMGVKQKQTVSGASRTPSVGTQVQRNTQRTVKLSSDDLDLADRWGTPVERLAKRKYHIEQNRRQDGYVPIMIPENKQ